MAALEYPTTLPGPTPTYNADAVEGRELVEGGVLGFHRRTTDQLYEAGVEFDLSEAEFGVWWTWWETALSRGGRWFSADWLILQGGVFRFDSEPEVRTLPGLRRAVSAKLVARGQTGVPVTDDVPGFVLIPPEMGVAVLPAVLSEIDGTVYWRLVLNRPALDTITLDLTLAGSATSGADFSLASSTITVNPGDKEALIEMSITNDSGIEADETITLTATRTAGQTTNMTASESITLISDDRPLFSINSISAAESSGAAVFTVTLSAAMATPATVSYSTEDATAVSGSDYTVTQGSLYFRPGETSKAVTVPLISDGVAEGSETFGVRLLSSWGAGIGTALGVCTIT